MDFYKKISRIVDVSLAKIPERVKCPICGTEYIENFKKNLSF
ncbi:hypothetical protein X275_01295 [Marinitoga sp. 1197]|nr:hypothetical protein UF08_17 [Marinitoga camini virus 1]KLO24053.1 hypothetical protein X275_01295 [Marinitoga sp. 1197]